MKMVRSAVIPAACALGCIAALVLVPAGGEAQDADAPIAELAKTLVEGDDEQRRDAAYALESRGEQAVEAIDALVKALGDSDGQVVATTLRTLQQLGPAAEPAIEPLIEVLGDRDDQRSYRAASVLGHIGPAAIDPLKKALESDRAQARRYAAEAFLWMEDVDPAVLQALQVRLSDQDEQARSAAARALGHFGEPAFAVLTQVFEEGSTDAQAAAAIAIAHAGPPAVGMAPHLRRTAGDQSEGLRRAALTALAAVHADTPEDIQLFLQALADSQAEIRAQGMAGLIHAGAAAHTAAPELARLLTESDPAVRYSAVLVLGRLGPGAATVVPDLIAALGQDRDLDAEIVHALAGIGPAAVDGLLAAASDAGRPSDLLAAALGEMGPAVVPSLVKAGQDPDVRVRALAARAWGAAQPVDATYGQHLQSALTDSEAAVRAAACHAVAQWGEAGRPMEPQVRAALDDPQPEVRAAAATALMAIGLPAEQLVPSLVKVLQDQTPEVRERAAAALAESESMAEVSVPPLVEALEDSHAGVRAQAAASLGAIGEAARSAAQGPLMARAQDPEPPVRRAVCQALGQLGEGSEVAEVLINRLRDSDQQVRLAAIAAVGQLGQQASAALEPLAECAADPAAEIRAAAIDAMCQVQSDKEQLAGTLIGILDDSDWVVRRQAMLGLGDLGETAKGAVPRLLALLDSEQDEDTAQSALREIDSAGPEAVPVLIELLQSDNRRSSFMALRLLGRAGPDAKEALPVLREMAEQRDRRSRRFLERTIAQIEGREVDDD